MKGLVEKSQNCSCICGHKLGFDVPDNSNMTDDSHNSEDPDDSDSKDSDDSVDK